MNFTPSVDKSVFALAPGFTASSLLVSCEGLRASPPASKILEDACALVMDGEPVWADDHLDAWASVFRQFGAKPQRTPCSAAALRKRVRRRGSLPSINPVVDIYNALSLIYAIPIGGENRDAYRGSPRLTVAAGNERFDTLHSGNPTTESPDPGEIIWRDDEGATCRRWNWRQGVRTQIGAETTNMWFVLECLEQFPTAILDEATTRLADALQPVLVKPVFELHRIRNK